MTPEIKQRIQQIRQGKIPKGYKRTNVGLIPLDWSLKPINHWITLKERPIQLLDDEEYQLVTIRRGYGGVDSRGYFYGKDILVKTYFMIHENDFIISKRQIAHGACGVAAKSVDNAVASNEYDVFIKNDCTDINMFNLMMQLPRFKRLFYLMSDGVHIEKLRFKTEDWMKQNLALPPLPEQTAIAEILSTQDRVIELKENLLAEKKRQKKYLMQQLLTGKMRLKGFKGEWKRCVGNEIFSYIRNGFVGTVTPFYVQNGHKYIQGNNIKDGKISSDNLMYVNDDFYNKHKNSILQTGDIVVIQSGDIGNCAVVTSEFNQSNCHALIIMTPRKAIDSVYISYLLNSCVGKAMIENYITGNTIKHILASDYKKLHYILPPLPEQTAIAEILSTADREIELLMQSIEQEKLKKKSLMQLLLTGIVRVGGVL